MIPITDAKVEKYVYAVLPERDEVLREMEKQAAARDIPIVGPAVGRLFFLLARIARAKTVFELGSAIGYSTIWWARAVGPQGRVIYTDMSEKNPAEASGYFKRAGLADRIDMRIGDALETLSKEKAASFDVIFNDVDKEFYPRVFELAKDRVRNGGLFVTDNVLWSGKVTEPKSADASTKAIIEFNRLLYASPEFFTSIIPLRDGVAVAQRREE